MLINRYLPKPEAWSENVIEPMEAEVTLDKRVSHDSNTAGQAGKEGLESTTEGHRLGGFQHAGQIFRGKKPGAASERVMG